ncbi:MAG: hypothetical protein GY769_05390 [bacterium]|nr:hypothetical protein [bacterium]
MGFSTENLGELQRLNRLRAGGACRNRFEGSGYPRVLVPLFEAEVAADIANTHEFRALGEEAECL